MPPLLRMCVTVEATLSAFTLMLCQVIDGHTPGRPVADRGRRARLPVRRLRRDGRRQILLVSSKLQQDGAQAPRDGDRFFEAAAVHGDSSWPVPPGPSPRAALRHRCCAARLQGTTADLRTSALCDQRTGGARLLGPAPTPVVATAPLRQGHEHAHDRRAAGHRPPHLRVYDHGRSRPHAGGAHVRRCRAHR